MTSKLREQWEDMAERVFMSREDLQQRIVELVQVHKLQAPINVKIGLGGLVMVYGANGGLTFDSRYVVTGGIKSQWTTVPLEEEYRLRLTVQVTPSNMPDNSDTRDKYLDEIAAMANRTRHKLQETIAQLALQTGTRGPLRVNMNPYSYSLLVTGANKAFHVYLKDIDRIPTVVDTVPLEDSYQVVPRVQVTPVSVTLTGSPISEDEHSPGLHYHIDDVGRDMIEGLHAVHMAYTDPAGLDEYIRSVPEGTHSREWNVGTGSEVYFDQKMAADEAAKLAEYPDLKFWYWGNTIRYRKYTKGKIGQTLAICNVQNSDYTDRICRLLQAAEGLDIEKAEHVLKHAGPAIGHDIYQQAADAAGVPKQQMKEQMFGTMYAATAPEPINVDRDRQPLFTPLECDPREEHQWLSAREVPGGCLVRMSTRRQSGDWPDHTMTFVPNVQIVLVGDRYKLEQDLRDQPQP